MSATNDQLPQLGANTITEVIAAMTPEEKVNFLIGTGMDFPGLPPKLQAPVVGSTNKGKVPGAAGNTCAIPRLGIPSIVMADGPAGVRINSHRENEAQTFFCTAFPIATLLASSWDVDLVESVGKAMGVEAKEYGVDILLAPALNIHRIPLGGRNFEYYSEDPWVSGKIAAAMTNGIQSQGVGTSVKHLVANNHEWNRNVINVKIDQRALREIYLKGFEIAIKESCPWTVMTSYNKVNGTYTSESAELLSTILREEWGYEGFVVTDWLAGRDPVAQLNAGNDLLMPGSIYQQEILLAAIRSGELEASICDRNIENILNIILQSPTFLGYQYSNAPDLKTDAAIARSAASQGMVLLRNQLETLPVSEKACFGVFGVTSYEMITGGTGSGNVNRAYTISLLEGLKSAGFSCSETIESRYNNFIDAQKLKRVEVTEAFMPHQALPECQFSDEDLSNFAAQTDIALMTIGRHSGEFVDREEEGGFFLTAEEEDLIARVSSAYHKQSKKVVVVLNIGGVVETASWRDQVDAILIAWQPGQESGHAIADVLSGRVNPSGKLATTFARRLTDYPSYENFPGITLIPADEEEKSPISGDKEAEISYNDSIWVGYRSFNAPSHRGNDSICYPFGFGLSYTDFTYSNLTLSDKQFDSKLEITVTITNTGDVAGKEVAQLYISAPCADLAKPEAELRAFAKTQLLAPQQSETVCFNIDVANLTSFDPELSKWVAEPGSYRVKIGASSLDIRLETGFNKSARTELGL